MGLSEFTKDGELYNMVSARVFYDDGAECRPGRNGINVRVELLPDLIAALRGAEAEAQAAGLLKRSEAGTVAVVTEAASDTAGVGDLTVLSGG